MSLSPTQYSPSSEPAEGMVSSKYVSKIVSLVVLEREGAYGRGNLSLCFNCRYAGKPDNRSRLMSASAAL